MYHQNINYATSQRRLQNALENKYSNGTRRRVRFLCPLFSSLALSHKMLWAKHESEWAAHRQWLILAAVVLSKWSACRACNAINYPGGAALHRKSTNKSQLSMIIFNSAQKLKRARARRQRRKQRNVCAGWWWVCFRFLSFARFHLIAAASA